MVNIKLSSENTSTKRMYAQCLWNFSLWLEGKTFEIPEYLPSKNGTYTLHTTKHTFAHPEEMLELLDRPMADSKHISRIAKDFLLEKQVVGISHILMYKSAILSYFNKNEQPIKISYKPVRPQRPHEQSMSLEQVRLFMGAADPMYRAAFMCKFQRGLDVSSLVDSFNFEARGQLYKQLGPKPAKWDLDLCPIPVVLTRVKTHYKHTGFLDRDAVACLRDYMRIGDSGKGPIFLNKRGAPITKHLLFHAFADIANKAGIRKVEVVDGRNRYNLDSHEMRDLLKSTLIDSGCRLDVADHCIGHMPKDSYEKQAQLYPDTLRTEYSKASARLNVLSSRGGTIHPKTAKAPKAPASIENMLERYDGAISDMQARLLELETLGKSLRELYAGR